MHPQALNSCPEEKKCQRYAFCDNNALYEYEILEFCYKAYKNFSISYIPFESKLKIIRQNWEIDGCTNRKPQIKLIK